MFKEIVTKNLKTARMKKNYTQQYVSDYLCTSQSNIAKYENGSLEPNIETIGMLADLYNISIDWLFKNKEMGKEV